MSYIDNPYNSEKGRKLLKDNLKRIFITGMEDNTFESEDTDLMVGNFRRQTAEIINAMKRFAKGYKQVSVGNAFDSGIYVCPNPECCRRDFIYQWESVDLGVYSPKEWLGSVKLSRGRAGLPNFGKGKFVVMHRVRCNTVTTCNKCHITYQGRIKHCPNSSCSGGNDYMVTVGCGEEACGMHYVDEKTLDQQFPTLGFEAVGSRWANTRVPILQHGKMTEEPGHEVAYELIQPEAGPYNGRPDDLYDVARSTPTMRITYGAGKGFTSTRNYPISLYRFGFTQIKKRYCMGWHGGRGDGRYDLTSDTGAELAECPSCGASEAPTVQESHYTNLPPRALMIENPQPLDPSPGGDILSWHQGSPLWQIYASDPNDTRERSNYLVPIAGTWNLQAIPSKVSSEETQIGRIACPNDVGFGEDAAAIANAKGAQTRNVVDYLMLPRARIINLDDSEDAYEEAKKDRDLPKLLSKKWKGYVVAIKSESGDDVVVSGIEIAENGNQTWDLTLKKKNINKFSAGIGESGPGFTFAVCEGRSKAAFKWAGKWVDCSPPCTSFRNQDGTLRTTPRHYPRFNQYPQWYWEGFGDKDWERAQRSLVRQNNYVPPDPAGFEIGSKYLWMDELSHLIMDPLRFNPIMEQAINNLMTYHTLYTVAEELQLDLGIKTVINECSTCKAAYQAGGMEKYRKAKGFLDAAGIVRSPFIYPQTVFDLEMEYQKKFGMNAIDKPIAWGIGPDGKKLVSNPTQIRI